MTQSALQNRRTASAGFTLIELSAALALVAILITFLPAVQKIREANNKQAVQRALEGMGARLVKQYQTGGKMAGSLQEALLAAEMAGSGDQISGYRLNLIEARQNLLRITAEPIPGVTGSETALLQIGITPSGAAYALNFTRTPGADAGRQRMLDEATEACARAFGRLASLLPAVQTESALKQVRSEAANTVRQQQTLDALRGNTGAVNFNSILEHLTTAPATTSSPSMKSIFTAVAQDFHRSLRLGALGENPALLGGITSLPAVQTTDRLLNFTRLAQLTKSLVEVPELQSALLAHVQAATLADSRGDLAARNKAMATYRGALTNEAERAFSWGMQGRAANSPDFRAMETLTPLAGAMQ